MINQKTVQIIKIVMICLVILTSVLVLNINNDAVAEQDNEDVGAYGLFTNISVNISGSNGVITATAKNEFTLGYSVIPTYVRLYCSESPQQSYENMTLKGESYTSDLDIGDMLTTSYSTEGRELYWKAVVVYKKDSSDWKTIETASVLFDSNGNLV
ncbi:MAG: hypothetical protein ACI4MY_04275 [Christensenellales bacterium]